MKIRELLGATEAISVEKITLYIPDRDKDERELPDLETWVEIATTLLAIISDGATRMPPCSAVWRVGTRLIREQTSLIYTYIEDPDRFEGEFGRIARFAHTFGKRTNQDTVFVELSGEAYADSAEGQAELRYISRAYRIRDFSHALADEIPTEDLLAHLAEGLG